MSFVPKDMNRREFMKASAATGAALMSGNVSLNFAQGLCEFTREKGVNTMEGQDRNNEQSGVRDKVIDIHLHIGGKGNSSPCKMSRKFLHSASYLYMVVRSGISLKELSRDHDTVLRKTMIERLNNASGIDFGVFLAFDSVYKENGEIDEKNSHMVTPNNYVMDIARDNPKVLFGASVHPNRGFTKGIEELDRCIEGGAVLIKWIPNSQIIDPSDRNYKWFYRKLADENLPLLCHTGPEHGIPVIKTEYQELGDPRKLRLALDTGVKVIAAHCATSLFSWEKSYLGELSEMFNERERRGWNLYADISAMCILFRVPIIDALLKKIPHDRMVLGSDYPIPVDRMPPEFIETLTFHEYSEIAKIDNPIEKNYRQLLAMNFPKEAMTKAASILRIPEEKKAAGDSAREGLEVQGNR
jgi:predicted TIM-barrel fold metal-dependent hydrolase